MVNLLENLVSVELTDEELSIINQAFDIIETKMPYLISLDDEELKALAKLHDGNRPFCEGVLTEMKLWKKPLDAPLSIAELEKDLSFTIKAANVILRSNKISKRLACTFTRAGAEALNMSLKLKDYLTYQSGLGTDDSKLAKAALSNINTYFKERAIKATKTRQANLLKRSTPAT